LKITSFVFPVLLLLAFQGCSSVQLASEAKDYSARQFIVPQGKANIYVVQAGGYLPSWNNVQVTVDGQPKGSLAASTYHLVVVEPGTHTVVVTSPENEEGVKLIVEADKNYFVGLKSRIGLNNMQVSVTKMNDPEGKEAVLNGKLAKGLFISE
jgi:hypothetical protein